MSKQVDICIIGGGIQGCGLAQAAAAAGYRVVLLEQHALAGATSGASSKLIHGGLRYLETLQFGLVAESLRERERLIRLAPELVRRVPFYIPVYKDTSRRPWQIFTGLSVYALLGKLKATSCFRKIPQSQWEQLDQIRTDGLQTVFQYYDAQTDDAALTRAVMYSACELGAELLCPARFNSAVLKNNRYEVEFEQDAQRHKLITTCLVNAAGPWVSSVQEAITPVVKPPSVELIQGAHLVLEHAAPRGVYYVESPQDRRAVFIMPWFGKTLIGTTETRVSGDPAQIQPTPHEVEYLLAIMRFYFPHSRDEIASTFAGARVLPVSDKHAFRRPRDTMFFQDPQLPGYLGLMGGKLTGYRATALKAVNAISDWLPTRIRKADTADIPLQPVTDWP